MIRYICSLVVVFCGCLFVLVAESNAQSRLFGDMFTLSAGNFPDSFGEIVEPVTQEFIDFDNPSVTLTFDGIEEAAGGLLVNERAVPYTGIEGGILTSQAAGIDGETEFDNLAYENSGDIVEFSFRTASGSWVADELTDQSFYTIEGLDWKNSEPELPILYNRGGFYFYFTEPGPDGTRVPVTGMETLQETVGLLVGEHPFDDSIPEVVYISYSDGQLEEITDYYDGGFDLYGGTSQLSEDASWALLAQVMNITIPSPTIDGYHTGFLVTPPNPDVVIAGDINSDGELTIADIDSLTNAVKNGQTGGNFDVNSDGAVTAADRLEWINNVRGTYVGDADLDGEFNSGDFVIVFQAGEYEDEVVGNSTWSSGDWNGDGEFDSSDFVMAFQEGGYELGPRPAVATVPEPASCVLILIGLLSLHFARKKQSS